MSNGAVMEKSVQENPQTESREVVQAAPVKGKMQPKKLLLTSILGLVLIIAIVAGTIGWRYMSSHESTDDAYVDGNITQISSRLTGTVSKVLVEDNQYVKAGQLLVVLDPRDYDIKIAQAKAALEKNESQQQADTADVSVTDSTAGAQSETAASEISHANASISSAKSLVANFRAALGMEAAKLTSLQAQQQQYEN